MPLIDIWKASPASVAAFSIEQIVSAAGGGHLADGNDCSLELRDYLSQISSQKLGDYAIRCLDKQFPGRGFVLQDIVNEFGRRLGFCVKNGRYQGTVSDIGFDGLWRMNGGQGIVVEVKTTDVFSINLDVVASYRNRLIENRDVDANSSILLVVGNADTGGLEAQIRGSRHAWDTRLISVGALADLVRLYETSRSTSIQQRVRELLSPLEFTRLDGLATLLLQAAEETADAREEAYAGSIDSGEEDNEGSAGAGDNMPSDEGQSQITDFVALKALRIRAVKAFELRCGAAMNKRTAATFASHDKSYRLACTFSKNYSLAAGISKTYPYWYAFHPNWKDFLSTGESFLSLGFFDQPRVAFIPFSVIDGILPRLNTTTRPNGQTYWHIHLVETGPTSTLAIRLKDAAPVSLAAYLTDI